MPNERWLLTAATSHRHSLTFTLIQTQHVANGIAIASRRTVLSSLSAAAAADTAVVVLNSHLSSSRSRRIIGVADREEEKEEEGQKEHDLGGVEGASQPTS